MSTKSYKRGVADTANAFAEFEKKQGKALNVLGKDIKTINNTINDLCDFISEKDKEAIYGFSTSIEIKELDEHIKTIIVSLLYKLADDKAPTEEQSFFIQSIQKYLSVNDISIGIDCSIIDNIDSISMQKAIFQVIVEYLALQTSDVYDETELQNKILLSFCLSESQKNEIIEKVEFVQKILGNGGLSQKYTPIQKKDNSTTENTQEKEIAINTILEYIAKNFDKIAETSEYVLLYNYLNYDNGRFCAVNKHTGTICEKDFSSDDNYIGKCFSYDDKIYTYLDGFVYEISPDTMEVSKFRCMIDNGNTRCGDIHLITNNFIIYTGRGLSIYNYRTNDNIAIKNAYLPRFVCSYKTDFIFENSGIIQYYASKTNEVKSVCECEKLWKREFAGGNRCYGYIYNDTLFLVLTCSDGRWGKYKIFKIDMNTKNSSCLSEGLFYDEVGEGFSICGKGFYFFSEASDLDYQCTPSFNLMYFSFEDEKVIEVAIGWGEKSEIKVRYGLFSTKTETIHNINPTISIDAFIISNTDHRKKIFSCVNTKKPMIVNTYTYCTI